MQKVLLKRGKARDIYELLGNRLLIVAIEKKGIVKTHFISATQKSMIVKRAIAIPLEFIVRGYLYGSAWFSSLPKQKKVMTSR